MLTEVQLNTPKITRTLTALMAMAAIITLASCASRRSEAAADAAASRLQYMKNKRSFERNRLVNASSIRTQSNFSRHWNGFDYIMQPDQTLDINGDSK